MHRVNDTQIVQAAMRDLFTDERTGKDTCHVAVEFEYGISNDGHQPNVAAAVDQSVIARDQLAAKSFRRLGLFTSRAMARSSEDTNSPGQIIHRSETLRTISSSPTTAPFVNGSI